MGRRQTVTLRLPLDAASVIIFEPLSCRPDIVRNDEIDSDRSIKCAAEEDYLSTECGCCLATYWMCWEWIRVTHQLIWYCAHVVIGQDSHIDVYKNRGLALRAQTSECCREARRHTRRVPAVHDGFEPAVDQYITACFTLTVVKHAP